MLPRRRKERLENELIQQLLQLFPNGDPEYFRDCLQYYTHSPVERITEKIVESGGSYPQLPDIETGGNRLDACLRKLALELFPDCDIEYLRNKVLQYNYAHVENVTNDLLSGHKYPERLEYGRMMDSQGIRSEEYKKQAESQLMKEFPQIWKSSIRAVLAENNWDFLHSYEQLADMGFGGFWHTIRNFFVHWSATPHHPVSLNNPQLIEQVKVIGQRRVDVQINIDNDLAHTLNVKEYDENNQLITCNCCYSDYAFEDLLFCSEGTHGFCHGCIRHYITEGLFGQGSLRGQSRILCISSMDQCQGCLPRHSLQKVLSEDIWKTYENSQLENSCAEYAKVQCCGCPYFELDDNIRPLEEVTLYANNTVSRIAKWIMVVETVFISYYLLRSNYPSFSYHYYPIFIIPLQWFTFKKWDLRGDLEIAYNRIIKSRRGVLFQCKDANCGILTCLDCRRPVRGMHKCREEQTDGLRLYVEKAMADAVKRTVSVY
ncbi:hypothetical protein BDB01DRAFT_717746 [Pilobolus umbonatus]|nr:hypothetical protein BDB01DRAFT_717746 [Pilobolus umbonatus]